MERPRQNIRLRIHRDDLVIYSKGESDGFSKTERNTELTNLLCEMIQRPDLFIVQVMNEKPGIFHTNNQYVPITATPPTVAEFNQKLCDAVDQFIKRATVVLKMDTGIEDYDTYTQFCTATTDYEPPEISIQDVLEDVGLMEATRLHHGDNTIPILEELLILRDEVADISTGSLRPDGWEPTFRIGITPKYVRDFVLKPNAPEQPQPPQPPRIGR